MLQSYILDFVIILKRILSRGYGQLFLPQNSPSGTEVRLSQVTDHVNLGLAVIELGM